MDVAPPGPPPPPPPPPVEDHCYRHTSVVTGVHCTRCGRAICTECMHPAPVGHQCPECVRGAKQEFHRAGRNIGSSPSGVTLTKILLGILVAVYAVEVVVAGAGSLMSGPSAQALVDLGGSAGFLVAQGETWRLFTAMFLHIGIFHLLMNGYALYIFGGVIEAEDGKLRFAAIFLIGGLFASAVSYAFGEPLVVSAGASGAIFALIGAFLGTAWVHRDLAFYAARVRTAMMLLALNLVIAVSAGGSIDWRAHAGGLVAGVVLGFVAGRWRSKPGPFIAACAGLLLIGAAMTMWRTDQLVTMFGL